MEIIIILSIVLLFLIISIILCIIRRIIKSKAKKYDILISDLEQIVKEKKIEIENLYQKRI